MGYRIEDIEGIGPAFARKLTAAGIRTTGRLLNACATPAGRRDLAETSGLSESRILEWANMADLMRINGVGPQFSELLKGAGVDTVKELRTRMPENLARKMGEVNAARKLTRVVPPAATVRRWVDAAKSLDPKLTY